MIYSKELIADILSKSPWQRDCNKDAVAQFVANEIQRYGKIRQAYVDALKAMENETRRHEQAVATVLSAVSDIRKTCDHPCTTASTGAMPGESYSTCNICGQNL